jgi:hypothetical protein
MSAWLGSSNGIKACLILRLTRTKRCAMAAAGTMKARAIASASMPSTVCNIKGARSAASMAGWAQTNSNFMRLSGMASISTFEMSFSSIASSSIGTLVRAAALCHTSVWRWRVRLALCVGRVQRRQPAAEGRTSIKPNWADGHFSAHFSASSRFGTSIDKDQDVFRSFVSAGAPDGAQTVLNPCCAAPPRCH